MSHSRNSIQCGVSGGKNNSMGTVLQKKQFLGLSCASAQDFVWTQMCGTFSSVVKLEMEC